MASIQVNIDREMTRMVKSFRKLELQELLGHAGRNKSGKKDELVERALYLIKTSGCNKDIQTKVLDLYCRRYPLQAPMLKTKFPSLLHQDGVNGNVGDTQSFHLPHQVVPERCSDVSKLPIKLKPLPFYENLSEILSPVVLKPSSFHPMQTCTLKFRISNQQIAKLSIGNPGYSSSQRKVQVQLRFCKLDTASEQPDRFPQELAVSVNDYPVRLPAVIPPTKTGDEIKQPFRPLNITHICENIGYHKWFNLCVKWSKHTNQMYVASINLVQQLSVDELLKRLDQVSVLNPSVSQTLVQEMLANDPESDIATTNMKVSLLCPLGKMRIRIPTRPKHCRHLQCFDASLFLMMNEKKPTWTCPVCDKSAEFDSLRVDGLFINILQNCQSDEVEFSQDGKWHNAKRKAETTSDSLKPIDLSQSAPKVCGNEDKKESLIIDLTCDSSDDEQVKETTKPSVVDALASSSSPRDTESPNARYGSLSASYLDQHTSSYRKSPQQKISKSSFSPARFPYVNGDSTRPRSKPYGTKGSYDLSSHQTPISQFSSFSYNGSSDPSANHKIPSPFMTSTPPLNGIPSPFPVLDYGLETNFPSLGVDPSFFLRFSQHTAALDVTNPRYFLNFPGTSSLPPPYLLPPPFGFPQSAYDLRNLPQSSHTSAANTPRPPECGLNTPQQDFSDDLNLDSIAVD